MKLPFKVTRLFTKTINDKYRWTAIVFLKDTVYCSFSVCGYSDFQTEQDASNNLVEVLTGLKLLEKSKKKVLTQSSK